MDIITPLFTLFLFAILGFIVLIYWVGIVLILVLLWKIGEIIIKYLKKWKVKKEM